MCVSLDTFVMVMILAGETKDISYDNVAGVVQPVAAPGAGALLKLGVRVTVVNRMWFVSFARHS